MKKPTRKPLRKPLRHVFPTVAKAWDDYGHSIKWDDLVDIKVGAHGYVALAWMEGDDEVNYADLASPDRGVTWEMQNDGHEFVSLEVWQKARVVPECDWLDISKLA